jgi:hypothetical protein
MKKIIFLLIVPIFFGFRTGQEMDEKRMNRDLEIAKNILATLIKSGSDSYFGGTTIEASYIKDYGVIFNIPEHMVYFHSGPKTIIAIPDLPELDEMDMDFHLDMDVDVEQQKELIKKEKKQIEKEKKIIEKEKQKIEKEKAKQEKAMHENIQQEMLSAEFESARANAEVAAREAHREYSRQRERVAGLAETRELKKIYVTSDKTSEIDWEEIMFTFLADYADLIGQLKPDEKIVVNQKSPYDELIYRWSGTGTDENDNSDKLGLSVEVLRKDVNAYKMGKINRDEFDKRITVKKNEPQRKMPDLEMFASIFDRYYSYDLSETFYCDEKPRYEVLEGFGAVFHIKASSASSSNGRVHFYSPGEAWKMEPDTDEGDDISLYPKFKDDIKAFMLDYGRTIRSLNDDDKVMLEIKINSCRDCKIPKTLEISSRMSLLKQYDQQKISREKAMAEIEIKEQF